MNLISHNLTILFTIAVFCHTIDTQFIWDFELNCDVFTPVKTSITARSSRDLNTAIFGINDSQVVEGLFHHFERSPSMNLANRLSISRKIHA